MVDRINDQYEESMKKLAFVIPWYGEDIPGGAEAALRGLVHHLQDAGMILEVLTTCVKDFLSDWNVNYHKPGLYQVEGIPVRRFAVRKRNKKAFDRINCKLMAGQKVTYEEEKIFMKEMVNSPDLYKYIRNHKDEYHLFIFIPYMFGTTFFGVQECMEKAVLIPCFHDESYAYMTLFKQVFSRVAGMIFHSEPERMLAENLYGVSGITFTTLGGGIYTDFQAYPDHFRDKYGINSPFLLYAGRKEAGKKVDVLINYFSRFKRGQISDLKLVLIGGGQIDTSCCKDIIDLGFIPIQDKYDAYAAASVFCNPSQMESFSIVIMESWISGTPVLVNGDCPVTRDFVIRAGGGLYYENYAEFKNCLLFLLEQKSIASQMGRNGCKYVRDNFSWDVIVKNYSAFLGNAFNSTEA